MATPPDDFSGLFENLPMGAFRTRPDGVMLRANPALVRLNGFASEAEHLAAVTDIAGHWYVQPGRRAEQQALLEREGRVAAMASEVWRYKTRERIWVSETIHTIRDAEGRVVPYEGAVEEITERVQRRRAAPGTRTGLGAAYPGHRPPPAGAVGRQPRPEQRAEGDACR